MGQIDWDLSDVPKVTGERPSRKRLRSSGGWPADKTAPKTRQPKENGYLLGQEGPLKRPEGEAAPSPGTIVSANQEQIS
jgi:hypothetical protein